jgi:hypothetical protein
MANTDFVTVVSGLPRSGTSLMMQMLAAGSLPLLVDAKREPDIDSPRGYFELEDVKALSRNHAFLNDAQGRAVKIIHALLQHLPLDRQYRVIFMRRSLDEVWASQRKMLDRTGHTGAALTAPQLKAIYARQLEQLRRWLADHGDCIQTLEVEYGLLIADPNRAAGRINTFLGGVLDETKMTAAVDPSLHRNRG